MMNDLVWEMEHSVETAANLAFAWNYMTDLANWEDPPARFQLDGPFAEGARGTTTIPGQEVRRWQLRNVVPMQSYSVEFPLEQASLLARWEFSQLADGKTRLTQKIVLQGEKASQYIADVKEALGANLGPGMDKIAARIGEAKLNAN